MVRSFRFLPRAAVACVVLVGSTGAVGGWPASPDRFPSALAAVDSPVHQVSGVGARAAGQVVRSAGQPAQASKPSQAPRTSSASKPGSARLAVIVFVTDPTGRPWEKVKVSAIGAVTREATSDRDGVARLNALRAGTYRVRFESPQVVTFEREIAVKSGPTAEVEVTLNAAPASVAPPPQGAKPGAPADPVPATDPETRTAWFAPTAASLPDWIERHYIGRTDPHTEGIVGKATGAEASVLQIRDPIADRARPDADQFFYVIAGDGTARVGDRQESVTAGWLVVVPRGTSVSFERRGRNPLILLAIVAPRR